jgi:hypothetical protein
MIDFLYGGRAKSKASARDFGEGVHGYCHTIVTDLLLTPCPAGGQVEA